jgi:branched-chain amino acid aminotransferase
VFRPLEHFERMRRNGRILKMYVEQSAGELAAITAELLRRNAYRGDVYIRPLLYKSVEKVGVRLPDEHDICVFAVPAAHYFDLARPLSACVSSWRRLEDNAIPGRGKICGAYVNSALAAQEARDNGFDEAIFLNEDGHVAEGSAMNLFLVRDGCLHTPSSAQNILEGITRATIMEIAKSELGIGTEIRSIDRTELYQADELFFCGTMAEVAAIGSVDHRPVGSGGVGSITRRLQEMFFQVVLGKISKYRHWLMPVYQPEASGDALRDVPCEAIV